MEFHKREKRVFFMQSKKKINAELEQTHGDEKTRKNNVKLLPYERVIDWIGKFDDAVYYENEQVGTEGKWEHELTCIPPGKNYIALSEKAGYPEPVFVAGKKILEFIIKIASFAAIVDNYCKSWTLGGTISLEQ